MAGGGSWLRNAPLLRLISIYREMPVRFAITLALFVVVNAATVGQQWMIGRAVDEVRAGRVVARLPDGLLDYDRAWFWIAALTGLAVARSVIQYGAGVISLVIGQELLSIIRERILEQVQRLDLSYHWRHGAGELITRTTRDADKVRDALVGFWRQVVETALVLLGAVAILVYYAPLLGLVPLLLLAAGLAVLLRQTDRLVRLDRAVGDAYDSVTQDLTEGISGVRVVKAFGLETRRSADFAGQVGAFTAAARRALAYATRSIPIPQIIIASGQVWVLGCGAVLVARGDLSVGSLVAALLAANTLVLRIETIGTVMQTFADARSSAGRICELLDEPVRTAPGTAVVPDGPLGLRLDGVRLAAPGGGNDILRGLTFDVRPGEIVALVGNTGAGKSSALNLLPRLLGQDGGTIAIGSDALGWHDIRTLDTDALRRRLHVVPQEAFLFSDTLAANLRLARPGATEAELRHALRLAAAEEVLDGLPGGFGATLGDRGVTLSGGQRQRLCLARAFLSGASILALDEATSALDAATERRVLDNIRGLREHGSAVTVLIVSSRLSTILMADRVLLLSGGDIVAEGTHDDMAARHASYRELIGLRDGE